MSSIWDGEDTIAGVIWILTSIGSLNWGLVEFFDYNAVAEFSTALSSPVVATVVYGAVAVAGVITLADHLGVYDVTDVVDSIRGDDS
ncbi:MULTISPECIES: DUF378 domain-containing protein [Halorubrum]|uniref:DUF378 domain-containing protein n=1 Tax=Halorubrum tropicale TaxID=1765655 RepID=A0A0N0UAN7_9EURY|nr:MULTISPECIES: DUF378 domain-containing protein [Halorubrum]KOX96960.1 hypothetical protein AMR74_05915 [Halorubrum tropicale]TKX46077.1 DUF378 domain-containing protein [Halorubrum sp. ARQ200]TKX50081.1 DUF378 domain-containing protein [Halorubrum sp. ASP121]